MRRRLIAACVVLVTLALAVFTVPVALDLDRVLRDDQREVALREARTIAVLLSTATEADEETAEGAELALVRLRAELEAQTDGRVELLSPDGAPALGRAVAGADDSDFAAALSGEERVRTREDSVLGEPGLQVTVPATTDAGVVDGAVRLTLPTAPVDEQLRSIWLFRGAVGLAVLGLAGLASALISTSLLRPLRLLDAMAGRMSQGDFDARLDPASVGPAETRRLAETLNDGAHRIGVLLAAQQAFTADASHQLRTPLTALRLSLDNLHDRLESPGDRAAVDRALAEAGRLGRLVSDLLVLARSQAPTRPREPVDVAAVLRARAAFWAAAADDAGAELVLSASRGAPRALLTPGHLEQAVDNLVDNALHAGAGRVSLRVAERGQELVVEIADTGPGMSAADRSRAFDRFWSASPDGSGLGLAIARQVVEHDSGTIELLDTPGGGLTARIGLRRAE